MIMMMKMIMKIVMMMIMGFFVENIILFLRKKNQSLMNDCFKLHFVNCDEGPPLVRVNFYYIC